jgi:endonuclease-3 related protein
VRRPATKPPTLRRIFKLLHAHYGPTGWWPGDSPFEIAVGAILVQNTAWTNVERAIANLKARKLLHPKRIVESPRDALEAAIRPSGYFRVKATRLVSFCGYLLTRHRGSMARMAKLDTETLRDELLDIHGIGPETADDILLYACDKPVFVVDAYTRRILSRHGLVDPRINYEPLRTFCETTLPRDLETYKELHGLLVFTGKDHCKKHPNCEFCPLAPTLRNNPPLHTETTQRRGTL